MGSLFSKEDRRKIDRLLELKTRSVTPEEKREGHEIEVYFREKDMSVLKYEGTKSAELRAALEDEEKYRSDSGADYEPIFPRLESSPSKFDGDSQAYIAHGFESCKDREAFEKIWWGTTRMVEDLAWSLNLRRNFIIFVSKLEKKLLSAPEPLVSIYKKKFDKDFNLRPELKDSIIEDLYHQLKSDAQDLRCVKVGIRPIPDIYIRKMAVLMHMIREYTEHHRHNSFLSHPPRTATEATLDFDTQLLTREVLKQDPSLEFLKMNKQWHLGKARRELTSKLKPIMDGFIHEVLTDMGPQRVNNGKDGREIEGNPYFHEKPSKYEGVPPLSPVMNLVSRYAGRFYGLPEDVIRDINRMLDLMICHHVPYFVFKQPKHFTDYPYYENGCGVRIVKDCIYRGVKIEKILGDNTVWAGRLFDKDQDFLGWEKTDWEAHALGMPKMGYQLDRHPAYDGKPTIWDPADCGPNIQYKCTYGEYAKESPPRLYSEETGRVLPVTERRIPLELRPTMTDLPADKRDEGYEFDLFYGPKPNAHVRAYTLLKGLITAGYVDKDNISFSDIALATRWAFYTAFPASIVMALDMLGEKPNWWTPMTKPDQYNTPYRTMLQGQVRYMEEVLFGIWKTFPEEEMPGKKGKRQTYREKEVEDERVYIKRVPQTGRNFMAAVYELNGRLNIQYQAGSPDGNEIISRAIAYERDVSHRSPRGRRGLSLKEIGRRKRDFTSLDRQSTKKMADGKVCMVYYYQPDETAKALENRLDCYSASSVDSLFMRSFGSCFDSRYIWSLPDRDREPIFDKAKEDYGIDIPKAEGEIIRILDSTRPDGGRSIIIKDPKREPDGNMFHLYPDYVYGNLFKVEKVEKDQYGFERIHIDPSSIHKNLNERNFTKEEILQALQSHENFRSLRFKNKEVPCRDEIEPFFDDER